MCPVLVSATMVVVASAYLVLARSRFLKAPNPFQWVLLAAGSVLMLYAFMAHISAYEAAMPGTPPFDWLWFGAGYTLAVLGALHLLLSYYRQPKSRFF
ncbi:MAG TPA: hypothetical protein VL359_00235, partial [bacterium]|nr:hypothetical protein [bacterium]